MIADGRMDLALVSITEPPSPLIALRELTREPLVFVCAPSHPLANRAQVDIADLIAEELIGFPTGWASVAASIPPSPPSAPNHGPPTRLPTTPSPPSSIRHRLATAAACAYPPGFAPLEEPRTCDAPRAVKLR